MQVYAASESFGQQLAAITIVVARTGRRVLRHTAVTTVALSGFRLCYFRVREHLMSHRCHARHARRRVESS